MTTKNILIAVVAAVIVFGAGFYVSRVFPSGVNAGVSPQGSTGRTATQAAIYGVALATIGVNATSSSVLNSSPNDYYPTGVVIGCEGVGTSKTPLTGTGLAALTVSVATSSTAAPATNGNTNLVTGGAITIPTSTPQQVVVTPLTGVTTASAVWGAGTYMTFEVDATNTAVCTFAVPYTSS